MLSMLGKVTWQQPLNIPNSPPQSHKINKITKIILIKFCNKTNGKVTL